ncbi:DNA cytosine methyltransferase [Neobacillus sp. NPDC093182]|uniref:DNA cytosine methyltransferase n=1 Tax=Neobacillus sp. NPDC093182 TaxID=3364297 RepID=UPI00380C77DF
MKVADFFCGAGGFSEGFRMAGFDIVLAVDKWQPALITHEKNHHKAETIPYDVEALSLLPEDEFEEIVKDTEIIIGSPPCVAFSNSNKSGKGDKSLGIRLVESYLRIIARKKFKDNPTLKYWILENVPNVKDFIKDKYTASELNITQFGFEDSPSNVLYVKNDSSGIYNAKYYGVAQNRKRYFCGDFPKPKKCIENDKDIVPLKNILDGVGSPIKSTIKAHITDPNYPTLKVKSCHLTDHFYIQEIAKHEWEKAKRAKTDKGYMGKMSFPENLNNPSRTIMATMSSSSRESIIYGIEGSSNKYRNPTIREIASIMSFPLDYKFYGDSILTKYRLVGNAVPPKLSFAFAKEIAIIEKMHIPKEYLKDSKRDVYDTDFTNLNNAEFTPKAEKRKELQKARFKYHIPYLIMDAYRVELTNYKSDFHNQSFKWEVELHKGQGKSSKVFYPKDVVIDYIDQSLMDEIKNFTHNITSSITSFFMLQENYCMTNDERQEKNIMGPDEILESVRKFIDTISNNNVKNSINQTEISLLGQLIPSEIGVGLIILNEIIETICEKDNSETSLVAMGER